MSKKDNVGNWCTHTCKFIGSVLPVVLIVVAFLGIIIGWFCFGLSPFHTIKELAYQQQQNDQKIDFVNFHNDLGIKFLYVKNFDAAREEFNQTLGVDSSNKKARIGLLECDLFNETSPLDFKCENSEITQMRLAEMIKQDQSDPLPYLYLGDLSVRTKDFKNATYYYTKTLQLDPSVSDAYEGLGFVCQKTQTQLSDEDKMFKKVANIAGFKYNKGNLSDFTLKMYEKAVDIAKDHSLYQTNLIAIYYDLGYYKNVTKLYELNNRSYRHCPNLDLYISLSNSYRCVGNLETAREIQEKQIKLMEDNKTKDQAINRYPFEYRTSLKNMTPLNTYDEKKYYFYYNIALTNYLLGNETKAQEYGTKADNLNLAIDSKSKVKEILDYDIKNFQKALSQNTTLIDKTNEFTNEFLAKMQPVT